MSEVAVETVTCALCGTTVPQTESRGVNQHPACAACALQVEKELAGEAPSAGSYAPAAILGLVGALLGAAVWAAIAAATSVEIGYVAVLVGFLAGLGVKKGAAGRRGKPLQLLAGGLAIVGLVVAKYAIFALAVMKYAAEKGGSVGFFDPRVFQAFGSALGQMLSPFDLLWVFLAVGAAYRVPAPRRVTIT